MNTGLKHWLQHDYRKNCLEFIIEGISQSKSLLDRRKDEDSNYGNYFFYEDIEQVLGLAFIAFQTYINGTIHDLFEELSDKEKYYKITPKVENSNRTKIELIIALANYFKHKDENRLHFTTEKTLRAFNLIDDSNPIRSPIIDALEILTVKYELKEILSILFDWRQNLFNYLNNQFKGD